MSESRTDLTLAAALRAMAPLVELLLREGVPYPRFAAALKTTFLESALHLLEKGSERVTDSRISTLAGVHRKDVREWRSVGQPLRNAKSSSVVAEVFTRWANDPDYRDAHGHPRVLDRTGGAGSFEALAASISNDVHPRTLLQELIRLGIAQRVDATSNGKGDKVRLCTDAFVPKEGSAELLQLFSDNVGDHLAAAVHNLAGSREPMLEQSVFADGLRPDSVLAMEKVARRIWSSAFHQIVREATVLNEHDRDESGADQRIRIGMYFYHGPKIRP